MLNSPRCIWRAARACWLLRSDLGEQGRPYLVEVATALRTLIDSSAPTRIAMAAYRTSMKIILFAGIADLVITGAVAYVLREHTIALVAALMLSIPGVLMCWQWYALSTAQRFLDEYADRTRDVRVSELPRHLRQLATDAEGLRKVPRELIRDLLCISDDVEQMPDEHTPA